jgi:hypothetical protein
VLLTPTSRREKFREIVNERGRQLRALPFFELQSRHITSPEHLSIDSRDATISVIVQPQPSGGLRVVVQGFMSTPPFRRIKTVALDGFYKYPDESIATMPEEEFYEFD